MTVIAAGKLDDDVAFGGAPGEAYGAHDGFGAGGYEADLFDSRVTGHHLLCQFDLHGGWRAEGCTAPHGVEHRPDHVPVGVAQYQGTPGADKVQVPVTVHVDYMGSVTASNDGRCAPDASERPYRGTHAARQDLERPAEPLR